jgi:glycerophosphoryl diester phosphodiesterase
MLTSFNFIALIQARDHNHNIPVGLLTPAGLANLTVTSKLVRFGPSVALHPSFVDVKPKLIQSLHRARSRIHAYPLKEADDMRQLFKLGVDGIITEDPPLATSVLSEIES